MKQKGTSNLEARERVGLGEPVYVPRVGHSSKERLRKMLTCSPKSAVTVTLPPLTALCGQRPCPNVPWLILASAALSEGNVPMGTVAQVPSISSTHWQSSAGT